MPVTCRDIAKGGQQTKKGFFDTKTRFCLVGYKSQIFLRYFLFGWTQKTIYQTETKRIFEKKKYKNKNVSTKNVQ